MTLLYLKTFRSRSVMMPVESVTVMPPFKSVLSVTVAVPGTVSVPPESIATASLEAIVTCCAEAGVAAINPTSALDASKARRALRENSSEDEVDTDTAMEKNPQQTPRPLQADISDDA